ncbi:hypothetical protein HDV05_003789 [Chytridiales sp. JEL 0842]|nr:hypothetical protein HDV05_003789 [Chytridiales sp. JEL 0842]
MHAHDASISISLPVLAVIGTTGVGKSALAIEIAKAVGGEIINADSMQVYKGLDIITNKVTPEEKAMADHHLMDFVDPMHEYSVSQFEKDAIAKIAEIHSRGKVPILVGGTHYYIQSVLWDSSLVSAPSTTTLSSSPEPTETEGSEKPASWIGNMHASLNPTLGSRILEALQQTGVEGGSGDGKVLSECEESKGGDLGVLLNGLLQEVDPVMAQRWHHKDWRKMRRSLQVYYTTGKKHSDIIKEQKESGGGALRYKTGVFWLWANNKALDPRLDGRVDDMIKNGLFEEIKDMRLKLHKGLVAGVQQSTHSDVSDGTSETTKTAAEQNSTSELKIDYTRGVLQSIGFKEFDAYLSALEKSQQEIELEKLKKEGLESMKAGTRRYARRQVTWIRNKLGKKCVEEWDQGKPVGFYALDATGACVFGAPLILLIRVCVESNENGVV